MAVFIVGKYNIIYSLLCFSTFFVFTVCENVHGHLKPLGHHRKSLGGVTILKEFPSPTDFYENYIAKSVPFIVKGVLENGQFPAYKLWTDQYLEKEYGSLFVDVEGGKKEDRKAQAYTMPMSKFLQIYNQSNVYMVHDVANEMKADITIPVSLQCGGFEKAIKSVIMWFSSGGTRSVLHNDGLDNINCLLDGNKDLIMFHKKYKPEIEADHFVHYGAYSSVDVEAVDMEKFPKLRDLPWYMANITKGDCLFIPYQWYHQVYSHSGRNLAINIWSNHLRWFDKTACKESENKLKPKPLNSLELKNDEESSLNDEIRDMFLDALDELTNANFGEFAGRIRKITVKEIPDDALTKMFDIIDNDKNGMLTMGEFHTCDYAEMFEQMPDFESFFTNNDQDALASNNDQPDNNYYTKEPMRIEMEDDVSFLLNPKKSLELTLNDENIQEETNDQIKNTVREEL
ncbi:uncharacterized protein LOC134715718 [Mytilus trossulus]|uniref:uncharacterized protein LOC134715718 n=1 Tax=Mytilus trossulus TaxID=6551 RepID=UPI0030040E4E